MNERFLYRGKRLDNGEWVTGYYRIDGKKVSLIYPCDYSKHNNIKDFIFECFEVDPSTRGQCTGLKDKNGTLIYEGDILKDVDGTLCEITWGMVGYICDAGNVKPENWNECEIISNIHNRMEETT